MVGIAVGANLITMARRAGGGAAPVAGANATTFATAPTCHFHPNAQQASVTKSGDIITACPDLRGLAALSGLSSIGAVVGPTEMTDLLGRKFWRFNGPQYALLENTLNAIANRGYMIAMVARVPHCRNTVPFANFRYAAYTNDTTNTVANGSIGCLRATVTSSSAMGLTSSSPTALSNVTDGWKALPGAQMQVIAVASRTTANGGIRYYINNDTVDVAQATTSVTGYVGLVLHGAGTASNSAAVTTQSNTAYDVYELAFWRGELNNAASDPCIAAMVSNFAIPATTQQYLIEGDSISDGIATTLPTSPAFSGNVAVWLTEPGAELVSPGTRVLNNAISGSQATTIANSITTRRDAANSHANWLIPGGPSKNKCIIQIGRNDIRDVANAQKNSGALYTDVVSIWNATTVGYLQRGWSGVQVANIAATTAAVTVNISPPGEDTLQKRVEGFRTLIADVANKTPNPTFLTDTLTNAGQAYDGLLTVLHTYAISQGGNEWFLDAVQTTDYANAVPPGPYDSDATHLVAEGCRLMATGGDTPQFGYGSVM
jgi:hypothetical protein